MKHLLTLIFTFLVFAQVLSVMERYDESSVYQMYLKTQKQVHLLERMQELRQVDIWSDNFSVNGTVDVRVPKEMKKKFAQVFFTEEKVAHTIEIENVQVLIDQELQSLAKRAVYETYTNKSQENSFFTSYHRLFEIQTWLRDRVAQFPNLSNLFTIGRSFEGRDQVGIKITSNTLNEKAKPAIFFHGGIHAREWVSPTTVMWIAKELLEKYATNPRVRKLVDNLVWYIVPVVNPDGYEYTHTRERLWRKTREPNAGSTCVGVDPNRNFEFRWNNGGSSSNPCNDAYHGPRPFSAIETKNIAEFGKRIPNLLGYIDYHAYSQLYMRPWGWTTTAPVDETRLKRIGDAAAAVISNKFKQTYRSGRIAVIIYIASGSSVDYFYGDLKANSFALELRPAGASGGGFVLPTAQIIPTGEENFDGVLEYAEQILKQ